MFKLWCEWGYSQHRTNNLLTDSSETKIERMNGQLTI